MKTTLLMAMTVNGFVTGPHDDTEWVKDIDALYKMTVDAGIAIMGKRTYEECVKYNAFPYKGALNIVMTHDTQLLTKSAGEVIFTDATPHEVLQLVKQKDFDHALIIGGGHINASFLNAGLIDEIIVDIHPLILTGGIRLFEGDIRDQALELMGYKQMNDGILQATYRVKRT